MLLTLVFNYKSIKWFLPFTVIIGTIPSFVIYWLTLRAITLVLPHSVYRRGDDFLYELYQRQLLFFFENFSGIKVSYLKKRVFFIKCVFSLSFFI